MVGHPGPLDAGAAGAWGAHSGQRAQVLPDRTPSILQNCGIAGMSLPVLNASQVIPHRLTKGEGVAEYLTFSETLIERHEFSFSELVPFNAAYVCWRSESMALVTPVRAPADFPPPARHALLGPPPPRMR
jgi:hypothetical protein